MSQGFVSNVANTTGLSGDVTGNNTATSVVRIQGNNVQSGALGSSQDGYVLSWKNTDSQWEPKPVTTLAPGASVGLASARPAATGSGKMYFCTDVPVMYVDDPTTMTWQQYTINYTPAGPTASSYTVVGKLGLTQYADSIHAAVYDTSSNIASCALAPATLGATPWSVTLRANFLSPTNVATPDFGVCVTNGTTSGTSTGYSMLVYNGNNGGGSSINLLGIAAITFTVGGAQTSTQNYSATAGPVNVGNLNLVHLRILCDGTNLHFQHGNGLFFYDLNTIALPTISQYGFMLGESTTAMTCSAIIYENKFSSSLTVPQSNVSAVASGTPPTITTSTNHNLNDGDMVTIHGVTGSGGVNTLTGPSLGTQVAGWQTGASLIHVTGATTFTIPNTTATGSYGGGGVVTCVSR